MEKIVYCFVVSALACASSCAAVAETAEFAAANRLALTVSQKVSKNAHVAHTPYSRSQALNIRHDLDETIRKREVDYTWDWIRNLMKRGFRCDLKEDDVLAVSDLLPHGDDGILIRWQAQGYMFEALDSRALTLAIRKDGLGGYDVEEVFKSLIRYDIYCSTTNAIRVISSTTKQISAVMAYGQIVVERKKNGWFRYPVEWYRDGDALFFVFEKVLVPPPTKGWILDESATMYIGGTRRDDERSFLRFENSNREQLAVEYFRITNPPVKAEPDPDINKKSHGLPIYVETPQSK